MYITLEIGMISHILATMFFHNFISPYLVQSPVTLSALFHNFFVILEKGKIHLEESHQLSYKCIPIIIGITGPPASNNVEVSL
jgi:hypothetical protein